MDNILNEIFEKHKLKMNYWLYKTLPKKLLSNMMYRLSRVESENVKNIIIHFYCKITKADTSFAEEKNPYAYTSLNAFFTRKLASGARSINTNPNMIVSPVDGRTAIYGPIKQGQLFQAKARKYSLSALLNDKKISEQYENGNSITLYLAPDDYHRVHAPCDCQLISMSFCPGNKHSVALDLLEKIPALFAGNERLVCHFKTPFGNMALIMVGALNVSSIQTVWAGELKNQENNHYHYDEPITFKKGDELGQFNLGSTVILCFEHAIHWHNDKIDTQEKIRMGEALAMAAEQ